MSHAAGSDTLEGVKVVLTMLTLLLVAIWLPASSHVVLETFDLIHGQHADQGQDDHSYPGDSHEHDSANHDAADGLCRLASFEVKFSAPQGVVSTLLNALLAVEGMGRCPENPALSSHALPELSKGWQFSFRTALPARAPSFVT